MRIVLTGGGTGGHLFPALAVADALRKLQPTPEILFIGSRKGIEATTVPQEGYAFEGLDARPMPRRPGLRFVRAIVATVRSVLRARSILDRWKPDVIFATGGYSSAAVLFAARLSGIPVILHEQNSVPGITNRIASRFAKEVHIGFSAARVFFKRRDHIRLTGNPVRETVVHGSRGKAIRVFRLDEKRRTVFVFGGSQGAHKLNRAIVDALPRFARRKDVQFLLQAGQKDYSWVLDRSRAVPVRTWVRPFIMNMGDAYAIADLVICRAGALTLAELAATGKPAILIPYPHATADHQTLNAEAIVDAGAAELITDEELDGDRLGERIEELLDRPRELRKMSIQALSFARLDATDRLVRAILRVAGSEPLIKEPSKKRRRGSGRRSRRGRNVAAQSP